MCSNTVICSSGTEPGEMLFQNAKCSDLKWYAVRTFSFRERVVAQLFASQDICHYMPLLNAKRRWSDRIKTIQVPLFKNYLFVKIAPTQEDFWRVLGTRGVTRILGDNKGPVSIVDEEIEAVARMLADESKLKTVCGFQTGQPVIVKAGSLEGMKGHFVQMKGKDHLAVYIDILGQAVLSEVNYCDVKPC